VQVEGELRTFDSGIVSAVLSDLSGKTRSESAIFVRHAGFKGEWYTGLVSSKCETDPGIIYRWVRFGAVIALPLPPDGAASFGSDGGSGENRLEIETSVEANLFEKISSADCILQRRQTEFGEELADFFGEFIAEADNVLGLAAEFRAKVRALRGDAGGARIEVALAGHVATERDENSGPEGVFVCAEESRNDDIAGGAKASVGTQTDAPAETVVDEDLLRFGEPEFPWIAGVLDAGERRSAGAARMARDDDVVRIGFGDPGGDGSDSATGDELDSDGSAWVGTLEIPDELSEIFNGIDVMVRRGRNQLHPGLGMTQACDEFRNFVTGKLAAFAGLCALGNLDLQFLGVGEVFGGDSKTRAGYLLDLVIEQ
jgi:hypothetical protein